jgi:hypothetical protein
MGSTHSGTPSPSWAMIEDSIEEFLTMSCMEGGFGLPSPRRRDMGALSAPVKTTPWMENALATQAMMTVPSRMAALRSNAGLLFEQRHTHQGGGAASASMCSTTHCRGQGNITVQQAHRQASCYGSPAARATTS